MSNESEPTSANPYAVGHEIEEASFEVQGRQLVVLPGTVLPDICIYTGKRVGWSSQVREVLRYRSAGSVLSKPCRIQYGVSWGIRLRIWALTACGGVFLIGALTALTTLLFGGLIEVVVSCVVVLVSGVFAFYSKAPRRLKVVACEDGRFWIEGFSDQFLTAVNEQKKS